MPLDPRAKRLLDLLAANRGSAVETAPAGRRAGLQQLALLAAGAGPQVAEVRDLEIASPAGSVTVRMYDAEPQARRPALLFLHGGGWIAGGLDTHDSFCRTLAVHGRCRVAALDYRRPPEHPHPAAVQDGLAALDWLTAQGGPVAIGGDSAGAHIAAEVCGRRREQVALQLLVCPILDPAGALPSRLIYAEGYFIDGETFARDRRCYFGSDARAVNLLETDLRGLPPTLVHVAEFDPFRDEGLAYADRLAAAGVPVRRSEHAGMIHYFYALAGAIPAARPMIEALAREMGDVLTAAPSRP